MTIKPAVRKERSVRLNEPEWILAEAIARMGGERSSAGLGIREALRIAEQHITADSGGLLAQVMQEIREERARRETSR